MATYAECIAEIKAAAGEVLSDDDVNDLVTMIQKRYAKRILVNSTESERAALAAVAKEVQEKLAEDSARAQVNAHLKVMVRQKLGAFMSNYGWEEKRTGARNFMTAGGRRDKGYGDGSSAESRGRAIEADVRSAMLTELQQAGVLELTWRMPEPLTRAVAKDKVELANAAIEGRPAKLVGSKEAQAIAKAFYKADETMRMMHVDAGDYVERVPGWLTRRSHNVWKLRAGGGTVEEQFNRWFDFVFPRLDKDRTFEGEIDPVKQKEMLLKSFRGLRSGQHFAEHDNDTGRFLHFKDSDAEVDYLYRFGNGDLTEAVSFGIHRGAQRVTLLRSFGPQPEAMFKSWMKEIQDGYAEHSTTGKKWTGYNASENEFKVLTGEAFVPGSPTLARIGYGIRAAINMASLGMVTLASLGDIPIKAATLRHAGVSYLDGYANGLRDLTRFHNTGMRKLIGLHLNVGIKGELGAHHARFAGEDSIPGFMSRMERGFFKANALSWWTRNKEHGAGMMIANSLAVNADKTFGSLDRMLRNTMTKYGIGEKEWDVIRRGAKHTDEEGDIYITPDAINGIDEAVLKPLAESLGLTLPRYRERLRQQMHEFFSDQLAAVITLGGAREAAVMTWATQPGTALGETARFFMHYKMFPLTFWNRHLARESGEWAQGHMRPMIQLIVGTTVAGYLAVSAKEIARGKEPMAPWDAKTFAKAMIAGGAGGIYADLLFAEYQRMTGGGLAAIAGPGIGKVDTMLTAFAMARDAGNKGASDTSLEAAARTFGKLGINSIPYANLFYTKAAIDYLIMHQINEWMNPGYLRRVEQRMKKEGHNYLLTPPSQTMPRGGGDEIFAGVR